MKFNQKWTGACVKGGVCGEYFTATVPGNIQLDYARAHDFPDVNWDETPEMFREFEDCGWTYKTEIEYAAGSDERVFFVTEGIEYEYDVILNSKKLLHHEGMFSKAEIDITDELKNGNTLEIYIYPHPKNKNAAPDCRDEANQSCKPAVCYGWDWHPRLLVSGIWNDTYIETRTDETITSCEVLYTLDDDLSGAHVSFDAECKGDLEYTLCDAEGRILYSGEKPECYVGDIKLWWCNGQGDPYLYKWSVKSKTDKKEGKVGFKRVKLVMHEGAWQYPAAFPKSRSNPPTTIELNGRRIFAKGSNWVNPEIFTGTMTADTYRPLIELAKDANMNILRCWGGACVDKEAFFEICDELGIMVWQEFPLSYNNYEGTDKYLAVLEQEAKAIIKRLRSHACLCLWCGGNELFNGWSGMTEQSYALRLLDKLCYEYDKKTPFIMTAPLSGMAHGYYAFYDYHENKSVIDMFSESACTAYSEFGVPSITEMKYLEKIMPKEILHKPQPHSAWELHHAYGAWIYAGMDSWMCFKILDIVFGKQKSLEDYIEKSIWAQCEGLKFIFEEARRQKPTCAMAINWCYNEPWITAAGLSLITYPDHPKKSYYAVKTSLANVVPSAKMNKFRYETGDVLQAEIWLLNDSCEKVGDEINVYLETDGERRHMLTWNTGDVMPGENKKGHIIQAEIGELKDEKIKLILEAKCGTNSYTLLYRNEPREEMPAGALNV